MKKIAVRLSVFCTYSVYLIYILMFSVLLINFILLRNNVENSSKYVIIGLAAAIPIGLIILYEIAAILGKFSGKKILITLMVLCFIYKLSWVLYFRIIPSVDYKTFFDTAAALSRSYLDKDNYIALFPHIMGYSLFLSIFFKIFGVHYLLPPLLNVILTTLSMALLFYICQKSCDKMTAIIACILWILFPSQTIYNILALSEPLYSTELLLIWASIIYMKDHFIGARIRNIYIYALISAFLVTILNMTRPLGAVVIIALILWMLLFDTDYYSNGENPLNIPGSRLSIRRLVYIMTMLFGFIVFSFAAKQYITQRLSQTPSSLPGYSIYVGFNAKSIGRWNTEDSALLDYYSSRPGFSADAVQKQMLNAALTRIKDRDFSLTKLIYDKFIVFLGDDSASVFYTSQVFAHPARLSVICNIFYYFLISMSVFGSYIAIENRNKSPLIIVGLYAIGLINAQMFVEVAPRYHYSVTLVLLIFAAYGVSGYKKLHQEPGTRLFSAIPRKFFDS